MPKFEILNRHIGALNCAWLLLLECWMGYRKETTAINSPRPEKKVRLHLGMIFCAKITICTAAKILSVWKVSKEKNALWIKSLNRPLNSSPMQAFEMHCAVLKLVLQFLKFPWHTTSYNIFICDVYSVTSCHLCKGDLVKHLECFVWILTTE